MKYYWTRFLPSYAQTIIYMLQESDYKPKQYVAWLNRSNDFQSITKRRQLDFTHKAKLLLTVVWLMLVTIYLAGVALFVESIIMGNVMVAGLAVLLFAGSPLLTAYIVIVPLYIGYAIIQAPRQRQMVASARQILAEHPALKIAIAGSYGKTTAKEILATILGEDKQIAFTPGNMNTSIGISSFAQTLKGDEEILVFELGEEQVGDVRELCNLIQPDVGIITGINEAHLSSFGTLERTVATIFELEDYLGTKPVYKNKESPLVVSKLKADDKLTFDRTGTDGWRVSNTKTSIHGMTFDITKNGKTMSAHTGLLGKHNIGVIVASVAIADSVGLTTEQIAVAINKTVPFEHRMQPRRLHGAWVVDDTYNGNSEGVQAGLLLLKDLEAKRRIYVTPGLVEQGDKTRQVHEKIGRQIAVVADVVVLMQNSVTDYITNGLREAGFGGRLLIIDDPLEFYSNLGHFVAAGDVVLMQNDWTDNYA